MTSEVKNIIKCLLSAHLLLLAVSTVTMISDITDQLYGHHSVVILEKGGITNTFTSENPIVCGLFVL